MLTTSLINMRKALLIIFTSVYMIILGCFLFFYYAPLGKINLSYNFSDKPTFISALEPAGRVWGREVNLKTNETYQRINGDPVYFTALAPRSFDKAKVTLEYLNPEQSIVELGVEKNAENNFEIKPLENKFINDSDWAYLNEDNNILLQKEKQFDSVGDFLAGIPQDKKIATYHYDLKPEVKIENYTPSNTIQTLDTKLIGTHEFNAYVEDEDLYVEFNFSDLNLKPDDDSIILKVSKGGNEVISEKIEDEDIQDFSKLIELSSLGTGLVKINIITSNDIQINNIKTKQQKFVAKTKVYPAEQENVLLYSDSSDLNFRAWTTSGLQEITVGAYEIAVNKVLKLFTWRETENDKHRQLKELILPKGGLEIIGDGYFAFQENIFFDPYQNIERLQNYSDMDNFDYVISSDYEIPVVKDNLVEATQEFNLDGVMGDRKELNFVISTPGMDEVNNDILLYKINIELTRDPIWKRLFNKLK